MANNRASFQIEDARMIFKNFSGREQRFNTEGMRNFAVVLDDETAEAMLKDGWNVKYLKPREDDEEPTETPYIPVSVSYKVRPPRVVMITSTGRTHLDEDSVGSLDFADIKHCDLIANGSNWETNGKSGVKAYLQTLVVTIEEDELERKYSLNE